MHQDRLLEALQSSIFLQISRCLDWLVVGSLTRVIALCQYEKIKKFVSTAKSQGATILTGGVRPKVMPQSTI